MDVVGYTPCVPICGDGLIKGTAESTIGRCDDGNNVSGDGCSSDCNVEDFYSCDGSATSCTSVSCSVGYFTL